MPCKYSRWTLIAVTAALAAGGCGSPKIGVYKVIRESMKPETVSAAPEDIHWVKPTAWEALPGTARRKANFRYVDETRGSVSIHLSAYPDSSGGLRNAANEWLQSFGEPELNTADFLEIARDAKIGGRDALEAKIVSQSDLSSGANVFLGISLLSSQWSWDIIATGPIELVESQSEAFEAFLHSISFERAAGDSSQADSLSGESRLAYTVPEGWEEVEHSDFRVASFVVRKEGLPDADVSVSWFPGEAGGIQANVNRWRRQLNLRPWDPSEVDRATRNRSIGNKVFKIFDLRANTGSGEDPAPERILAAITKDSRGIWFVKLRGDPFVVETQRRKLFSFLEHSRFGSETSDQ